MKARRSTGAVVAAAVSAALMLSSPALAAGPGGGGGPGGPGGGGGSGGGGGGGGGSEPPDVGSLYSELVLALRAVDGTPILKKYVVPPSEEEPEETTEYCVQPISLEAVPGVASSTNPVDGSTVWVLPLQGEWIENPPAGGLPVEEIEVCDAMPQYAMFVTEVELERLNLGRTADDVIASKLAAVETKLRFADDITLDGAGRITVDGQAIDASPEHAAMYDSLMRTGTIPGLPSDMAGPPAQIKIFDAWMLAAADIGTAAGKYVPINVDTVQYYNRVIGFPPPTDPTAEPPVPEYVSPWGMEFIRSDDPENPGNKLAEGERFVDYSGFSYNRSEVFQGSVTWLDVPNLKWKVSRLMDAVDFGDKEAIGTSTLTGLRAFAQLADDVRSVIVYYHENEVIPGFYMDPVGVDTTAAQEAAIVNPAVDLADLPDNVFRTLAFSMTASLFNPWGGTLIEEGRLRVTVDAEDALSEGDVAVSAKADGQAVPFTADPDGNLVGWWGPETGFPVQPGYNVSTAFDVTVGGTAPVGEYVVTLDLVDVGDVGDVLATDSGVITVNDNVATVLWGSPLPKMATQGSAVKIPVTVYSPELGTGRLTLTIAGPGDDPTTEVVEAMKAGDVRVYASNGTDMVAMPLELNGDALVGTWDAALVEGYSPVTWYATVAEGALVGNYTFGVALSGGNTLEPIVVAVAAPEAHGQKPPNSGEDALPPVVTVETDGELGSTATFRFTADTEGVIFECKLTKDGEVLGDWATCTSPKTYTDLQPGSYVFSVRGKKGELVSTVVTRSWLVEAPQDTTPPKVTITPAAEPGLAATFTLTADEEVTGFECMLRKNNKDGAWEACESPVTYADLKPASYVLSVRATDLAGNPSEVETYAWTATKAPSARPSKK